MLKEIEIDQAALLNRVVVVCVQCGEIPIVVGKNGESPSKLIRITKKNHMEQDPTHLVFSGKRSDLRDEWV